VIEVRIGRWHARSFESSLHFSCRGYFFQHRAARIRRTEVRLERCGCEDLRPE
jgi:hypothetical protein